MIVHADLRWPSGTGIGTVQSSVLARLPQDLEISNLGVPGRIGSPWSPFSIGRALKRKAGANGVFWTPGFMPPSWSALPTVVTVHDLTHLHYYSKFHGLYYSALLKPLYRRCRQVICVSNFTRNEFLNWSGVDPAIVHTVYNGVDTILFERADPVVSSFPYVLYAGNRRPYKNLDRLLKAFSISALRRDGVRLVLTGDADRHLTNFAARLGIDDALQFAGRVSDDTLARLYAGSRMVAFVSLYEGFGLPILEAMASSVPILTSNTSAMPEVAGNAALLVDPTSVEEIAQGLDRLHFDEGLRQNYIFMGRVNKLRFDWNITASATWNIVREAGT